MNNTVLLMLLSSCIFCAMILNLAAKPRFTKGLIGIFTLLAALGGLFFYGMGFAAVLSDPLQAVVRTVFDVSRMFAGVNDFSSISAAPVVSTQPGVTLFWVFHLMAFYAMASATISVLGASALKRLRFWLQRYFKSVIIYGLSEETLELARDLIANGEKHITFVCPSSNASLEAAASSDGCLVRSDSFALNPCRKFLKSLGSEKGTPELILYALDGNSQSNLSYASALIQALEESNVCPDKVRLVLRSSDDSVECGLAAAPGHYGYGSVMNFTESSLTGRILMKEMPPHSKMYFRPDGTAAGDFDAVIVGFGRTGRNVLRNLVRNAQFDGSHFRAAVFSYNIDSQNGYFFSTYPELMNQYDISFHMNDARSLVFYTYLKEHLSTLRYVVICTGIPALDNEIRSEVIAFLSAAGCDAAICSCSGKSVSWSPSPQGAVSRASLYSYRSICADNMDTLASVLNCSYLNDSSVTAEEAWRNCDYFSRESSRASADFIPAFLHISGLSSDSTPEDWMNLPPELLESMAKTEHLRWCAFHYSMGFSPMEDDTVRSRGEELLQRKQAGDTRPFKVCKDLDNRQHACLRPWEALDALSSLEQTYTGTYYDYKDADLRNVLSFPAIIKAGGSAEK